MLFGSFRFSLQKKKNRKQKWNNLTTTAEINCGNSNIEKKKARHAFINHMWENFARHFLYVQIQYLLLHFNFFFSLHFSKECGVAFIDWLNQPNQDIVRSGFGLIGLNDKKENRKNKILTYICLFCVSGWYSNICVVFVCCAVLHTFCND